MRKVGGQRKVGRWRLWKRRREKAAWKVQRVRMEGVEVLEGSPQVEVAVGLRLSEMRWDDASMHRRRARGGSEDQRVVAWPLTTKGRWMTSDVALQWRRTGEGVLK